MPYDGSGTFDRIHSWQADRDAGIDIDAARHDAEDDGFATGLSNCLTKDGQTLPTANLPMNSKKLTGLAAGTSSGDSVRYEQVPKLSTANTFTEPQKIENTTSAWLGLRDSDATAGKQAFSIIVRDGVFAIRNLTDAYALSSVHTQFTYGGGILVGAATGGDKGAGTGNFTALYENGTNISATYSPIAGSSSITTVGTITTGTWNGTDIAVADGGTGASDAATARTNLGAAPIASPTFTGTVTMPTTEFGNDRAQVGTFSATGASVGQRLGEGGGVAAHKRDSSTDSTASRNHNAFYNPNGLVGSIATSASATAYNTTSDGALKDKVIAADRAASIAVVKAGRPVEFEFKKEPGIKHLGFIAQEMAEVFPDAVTPPSAPGEPWMMDHSKLVPVLWATVQDLLARVEALESA